MFQSAEVFWSVDQDDVACLKESRQEHERIAKAASLHSRSRAISRAAISTSGEAASDSRLTMALCGNCFDNTSVLLRARPTGFHNSGGLHGSDGSVKKTSRCADTFGSWDRSEALPGSAVEEGGFIQQSFPSRIRFAHASR